MHTAVAAFDSLEGLLDSLEKGHLGDIDEGLAALGHALGAERVRLASARQTVASWSRDGGREVGTSGCGEILGAGGTARGNGHGPAGGRRIEMSPASRDGISIEVPAARGEPLRLTVEGADDRPEALQLVQLAARLLSHVLRRNQPVTPAEEARQPGRLRFPDNVVVGKSRRMERLHRELQAVVDGDFPVLLVGETGVGKEHLARTIHSSSRRAGGPFVAINCAAIPPDLLEAELFGIGRGVATGVSERAGKFREAAGGTLLLDEIGEMALPLQAKLLRALAEKEIPPVGSAATALDARIVAATNQDLAVRAERGEFRLDLYYRLAAYVIEVPPLRERPEDVPALLEHYLRRFEREMPGATMVRGLSWGALRRLLAHHWPGNVRELAHVARRLVMHAREDGVIAQLAVEAELGARTITKPEATGSLSFAENERALVLMALQRAAGNRTHAAQLLGISRSGLLKKLERLQIG